MICVDSDPHADVVFLYSECEMLVQWLPRANPLSSNSFVRIPTSVSPSQFQYTDSSSLTSSTDDSKHPAFRSLVGLVKETKEPTKEALKDLIAGRGF